MIQLLLQTIQIKTSESELMSSFFLRFFVWKYNNNVPVVTLPAVHGENNAGVHHRPQYCGGEEVSQEGTGDSTGDRHQPIPEAVLLLALPPQLQ